MHIQSSLLKLNLESLCARKATNLSVISLEIVSGRTICKICSPISDARDL